MKDISPKFPIISAEQEIVVPPLTEGLGATIGGVAGGRLATTVANAINSSGNLTNDVINAKLDTQAKTILGSFSFGASGAIQIGTYSAGVSGDVKISPNGILGRNKDNVTTFSIDATTGDATFGGTLAAAAGTLGAITIGTNAFHVDSSGNMWWGDFASYAAASIKISAAGVIYASGANLSGLVVGTNVGLGTAQDSAGVTTIIGNVVTTGFVNALNVTAQYVGASIAITSPTITGGTITGGTITGGTIQTASSGKRIIISSDNTIKFYSDIGKTGTIYGDTISGTEVIYISTSQPSGKILLNVGATGAIAFAVGDVIKGFYDGDGLTFSGDSYISRGAESVLHFTNSNIEFFKHFVPYTDNLLTCGSSGNRLSDLRAVLINGNDYGFEHQWWMTENYKVGIKEEGIAILNPENELMCFIGESGLYVKGGEVKNLDLLPYIKTTIKQRSQMDRFPELRNRSKNSKDLLKIPDFAEAKIGGVLYKESKSRTQYR